MRRRFLIYSLSAFFLVLAFYLWPSARIASFKFADSRSNQTNFNASSQKSIKDKKSKNELDDEIISRDAIPFEDILAEGKENSEEAASDKSGSGSPSQILVDPRDAYAQFSGIYGRNGEYGEIGGFSNSDYVSPEIEALREMAEGSLGNSASGFFGGARVTKPTAIPEEVVAAPTAGPTSTPDTRLQRLTGQARGYAMLYLMHPKARRAVEKQIDTMIKAEVNDLYLGVLIDGTFGRDFNYLNNVVRRIGREGRTLTLVVYLTNGSTMRIYDSTNIEAGFNKINPIDFRGLIRFDSSTREKFIDIIKPIVPILQTNRRLNENNRNFVVVMLEDNLDNESYISMRTLAQSVIGQRATYIRNPCQGTACIDGSTLDPLGDGLELHMPAELGGLEKSDGFTLDGTGHRLPEETNSLIPSYEETKDLAILAASRGLQYFGLWRFERQGLQFGFAPTNPDDRIYEVPTDEAAQAEIEILRAGLGPLNG